MIFGWADTYTNTCMHSLMELFVCVSEYFIVNARIVSYIIIHLEFMVYLVRLSIFQWRNRISLHMHACMCEHIWHLAWSDRRKKPMWLWLAINAGNRWKLDDKLVLWRHTPRMNLCPFCANCATVIFTKCIAHGMFLLCQRTNILLLL